MRVSGVQQALRCTQAVRAPRSRAAAEQLLSSASARLSAITPSCSAGSSPFHATQTLLQSSFSRHKIVIPHLSSLSPSNNTSSGSSSNRRDGSGSAAAAAAGSSSSPHSAFPSSSDDSEYRQHRHLSPHVAQFVSAEDAAEVHRAHQVDAFRASSDAMAHQLWRDSKSHLRRQQKLVEEFGVDGAVRETLQPSTTSFREQLRQRPLDRAILQEIYLGLHGRRVERKLKRGVSWEHWITKGDGTAPVFNTSEKAQQTFAFGGDIRQVRCATHPQQFPVVLSRAASSSSSSSSSTAPTSSARATASSAAHRSTRSAKGRPQQLPREHLLPEIAVIGRTSSGKSSLINAVVNATVTPYGHLRGTTNAVRFYNVANRLMLVDCPGYGHYDPMCTPAVDAENAVKAMRAYLACGASSSAAAVRRRQKRSRADARSSSNSSNRPDDDEEHSGGRADASDPAVSRAKQEADWPLSAHGQPHHQTKSNSNSGTRGSDGRLGVPTPLYQPRNLRRVLLCVSAHGMQHLDYEYCDLLESYQIPFSVVLTKTDAAPIRFLARLTDYTRSQLVRYTQCREILLTSSLRIAGIDKVQELLGSMAASDDPLHGATPDFSSIV